MGDAHGIGSYELESIAGRVLALVKPMGSDSKVLPIFIPTLCDRLNAGTRIPMKWLAVQLNGLINVRRNGTGTPQSWLKRGSMPAAHRVVRSASPIIMLHGDDEVLNCFWSSDRLELYELLKKLGATMVTAPTFSVYDDNADWPACHSVLMLMRHNRVLEELYRHGFTAIPNIYWRSASDRNNWASWLREHNEVAVVSRDLSCTGDKGNLEQQMSGLLKILETLGRRVHIIVQGVGIGNAATVLLAFDGIGCTCSITSGQPMMLGKAGKLLRVNEVDVLERSVQSPFGLHRTSLVNMRVFEAWLLRKVEALNSYRGRAWANGRWGSFAA